MHDVRILGISGSLRAASVNTALLRAAREHAPEGVQVEVVTLDDVPLYDGDVEREGGFPAAVADLRARLDDADALLLASPEYNWSTSGVLKNAIDWLSRGPDSPLDGKPTALVSGAGGSGGARAQAHLRDILRHNAVDVLDQAVQIPRAGRHVDDGRLTHDGYRDELLAVVAALADRVRDARREAA